MSVYIYSRQSSGSNDQSVSIDQQTENCQLIAEKNHLVVDKVFADYNCSGRLYPNQLKSLAEMDLVYKEYLKETKKTGQWRVELNNLLDALKKDDTILIDDKTRLCRSLNGSYLENAIIQILKDKNITLISAKEGPIDFRDFGQQLVFNLQSSINSDQLEKQRKKSKDSLTRMKRNGESFQSIGRIIGYQYTGRKYEVEVNPRAAEAVQFVFKSYIEGNSLFKITRDLSLKYKDVFRNGYTSPANVRKMLSRSLYAGYIELNDGTFVKSKQIEGKEIIDWNTFKLARDILDKRKTNRITIKKNKNFHFVGIMTCGYCGHKLNACMIGEKKYHSMRCKSKYYTYETNCKNSISIDTPYKHGLNLNQAVEPLLVIGLLKKLSESNNNSLADSLKNKQIELENIISAEKKLTDLFLKGLLEGTVLEQRLSEQKTIKNSLQQDIIDLQQQLSNNEDDEKTRKLISAVFNHKLTDEQYSELVARSIKKLVLYNDRLVVGTIEGDVVIHRYKEGNLLKLPNYIFSANPNNLKLYYYWTNFNIYKPQIKLLESDYLTVYIQQDEE